MNTKKTSIKKSDLRWENRYSDTEISDKQGRWARKCYFKDRHIAWINKIEHEGILRYKLLTQFPCNGNDMPHYVAIFETFKEAKECLEFFWEQFLKICR